MFKSTLASNFSVLETTEGFVSFPWLLLYTVTVPDYPASSV